MKFIHWISIFRSRVIAFICLLSSIMVIFSVFSIGITETINKQREKVKKAINEKQAKESKQRKGQVKPASPIKGMYETVYESTQKLREKEQAERERKRQEELARKRAEEEARRKAEEARRRAEESAQSPVEEEIGKEDGVCAPPDQQAKDDTNYRICFFALNGPEESEALDTKLEGFSCLQKREGGVTCKKRAESGDLPGGTPAVLEVQEFFADRSDRSSVRKAFEKMTNTHCDGLVISGNHMGYSSGKQTRQDRRNVDEVDLNLTFLEKLSCLQDENNGTNCKPWFNNIKYLHLHGSYTAGNKGGSADQESIRVINKFDDRVDWNSGKVRYLNREYANTVDDKNVLSDRYLRMFPGSQVFSYSAQARTIEQGSPQDFINTIEAFSALSDDSHSSFEAGLQNFLNFVNTEPSEDKDQMCQDIDKKWTRWDRQTDFVSSDESEQNEKARKTGCDFSNALESGDEKEILEALDPVLKDEKTIHQNLNRIFHALNDKSSLDQAVKDKILDRLKKSNKIKKVFKDQIKNHKIGFVRRADYLALYQKITKPHEHLSITSQYLEQLNQYTSLALQQIDNPKAMEAFQAMQAEVIWKNKLVKNSPEVDKMVGSLIRTNSPELKKQALILNMMNRGGRGREDLPSAIADISDPMERSWLAFDLTDVGSKYSPNNIQPVVDLYKQHEPLKDKSHAGYQQALLNTSRGIVHQLRQQCSKTNSCNSDFIDSVYRLPSNPTDFEKDLHSLLKRNISR